MDLSQIANILEPHEIEPEKLQELEADLLQKLKEVDEKAHEDRGALYYYLLRIRLYKNTLLEDQTIEKYLSEMLKNFKKHEKETANELQAEKDPSKRKIVGFQLKAFYNIIESYLLNLERSFEKKGFLDRLRQTYITKMHYREKKFWHTKNLGAWFAFFIWRHTSRYGESFGHWGMTNLITVLGYTIIFYLIGHYASEPTHAMVLENGGYLEGGIFNYLYYSIVTFTTLGYGDIVPVTFLEKIVAMIEVIQGYVMLGVFLTLLQKRL
jgi:hypothetical protein